MRFDMIDWKLCCSLVLTLASAGCGTQSAPVTEINLNERSAIADNSEPNDGLPLLAVPGPDEATANKAKITRTAATTKSGPSLLPKGLLGKKQAAQEANAAQELPNEAASPAQKIPEKGTPEWMLYEIQRIRLMPLPHEALHENESDDDEEEDQPLTPAQEKKLAEEIERTKHIRRERNLQIIKLAEECIQKTNKNPEQEPLFTNSVHHLLDARLQLALQGDAASIEALYDADKLFYARNPKSESASEASLILVNLTHATALRYGRKDPRWMKEFSKQAQSYASRFPEELPRSVPLLLAAGRTCEMNGQPEEARACYALLSSKFKDTPQGQQAAGILRRYDLKGRELQLAGPGIDGGDVDVKALKGKMVLVIFWASNAQPFLQQLPKITEVTTKFRKYVSVVGVNLDVDEKQVDSFVESHHLDWQQIFPANRQERGWNSPLTLQYGVNQLPTIWLLDPNGIVAETNLDATNLEAKIREVYEPFRTKKPATK